MTQISAKSILASIDSRGNRIDTILVTFPRFLLAELNTHRIFSRNSASSRAIPFEKMVESVEQNPFIPIAWQKDHKGMQGTEYFTDELNDIPHLNRMWLSGKDSAVGISKSMYNCFENKDGTIEGVTKQLCNRLLEPFMWHTVLISFTEIQNFFNLRCPQYGNDEQGYYKSKKDAIRGLQNKGVDISNLIKSTDLEWLKINKGQSEIHMMALAECIYDCINEAKVQRLKNGEWHIPFSDNIELSVLDKYYIFNKFTNIESINDLKIRIATARCARISYTTVGDNKQNSIESDLKLHDRLMESSHWSPFEHIAQSMSELEYYSFIKGKIPTIIEDLGDIVNCETYATGKYSNKNEKRYGWCNNFKGFISYRYQLENKI